MCVGLRVLRLSAANRSMPRDAQMTATNEYRLILYGLIAQVSVKEMFLGGILPGVVMVLLVVAWGVWVSKHDTTAIVDLKAASPTYVPGPAMDPTPGPDVSTGDGAGVDGPRWIDAVALDRLRRRGAVAVKLPGRHVAVGVIVVLARVGGGVAIVGRRHY